MKKILLFIVIILMIGEMKRSSAQSISILAVRDSLFTFSCGTGPAFYLDSYVVFEAIGFNATDTLDITFDFGDGTFTSTYHLVSWLFNNQGHNPINHLYQNYGSYDLTVIISGPGGIADTLVCYDETIVDSNCVNITWIVYNDLNSNCIYDASDVNIGGAIDVFNGTSHYGMNPLSYSAGVFYSFHLVNAAGYSLTCPAGGVMSFTANNDTTIYFAVECISNVFDYRVHHNARRLNPAVTTIYDIFTINDFCTGMSGTYSLILPPQINYLNAFPAPVSIIGDTITWTYTNVLYGNIASATVQANLAPGVQLGDTICSEAITKLHPNDLDPSNNYHTFCGVVNTSYDPNMKTVSPAGVGQAGFIQPGTDLLYTVHFQNTGTDTAYSVVIRDTLDSDLDIFNIQVVASSHPYQVFFLSQGVVEFRFPGILLPDSNVNEPESHGFISYEVSAPSNAAPGTEFTNTAHIYFDSNPAIVTNTTINTIPTSIGLSENQFSGFELYPNPANLETLLEMHVSGDYQISIVDLSGKQVETFSFKGADTNIDLSGYPQGIYIGRISSPDISVAFRLVVLH